MCPRLVPEQLYNHAYHGISGVNELRAIFAIILPPVPLVFWIWTSKFPYIGPGWLL
jgi:hypothetical protein